MGRYNSVEGIEDCLGSLEKLFALLNERKEALARGEPLSWFILLGRWSLRGAELNRIIDPDVPLADEPVLKVDGNWFKLKADQHQVGRIHLGCVPPAPTTCPHCGNGWSLANACQFEKHGEARVHPTCSADYKAEQLNL